MTIRAALKNDFIEVGKRDPVSVVRGQGASAMALDLSPVIDLTLETPLATETHSDVAHSEEIAEDDALLPEEKELELTASESERDGTSGVSETMEAEDEEQQQLLKTLVGPDFPDQDDDGDVDYTPDGTDEQGGIVGEKRPRSAGAHPENDGAMGRCR